MPRLKRYIVNQDNRILFFTSKPKKWNRTYWEDYNGYKYRITGIQPKETSSYQDLLELPEGRIIEVEMRIKVLSK